MPAKTISKEYWVNEEIFDAVFLILDAAVFGNVVISAQTTDVFKFGQAQPEVHRQIGHLAMQF